MRPGPAGAAHGRRRTVGREMVNLTVTVNLNMKKIRTRDRTPSRPAGWDRAARPGAGPQWHPMIESEPPLVTVTARQVAPAPSAVFVGECKPHWQPEARFRGLDSDLADGRAPGVGLGRSDCSAAAGAPGSPSFTVGLVKTRLTRPDGPGTEPSRSLISDGLTLLTCTPGPRRSSSCAF